MFGSIKPKTVVRKITKVVPAKPTQRLSDVANRSRSSTPATNSSSRQTNSHQASPASKSRTVNGRLATDSPAAGSRKRKASTPPPQWNDDDDDDDKNADNVSFDSPSRAGKRHGSSHVDTTRRLLDETKYDDGGIFDLAHGADLVSGENAAKYAPAFVEEQATEISLQYPSDSQPERFFLANSIERGGYSAIDDIRETVRHVCMHYLPADMAEAQSAETGFDRRLARAISRGSRAEFVDAVHDFNALIKTQWREGTIPRVLSAKHSLDSDWTRRILDQIYSRTVSPHVESLREYKNGTDNVYGELLYPFVSEILQETQLNSDQVFVDLGSGVGNVVLQAALEVGCESWGCEMMRNPCELARLQADEFLARARLWGLNVGEIQLLEGDFLDSPAVNKVLRRADVVLINNQAFGPDLNSKLVDRFLDLKDGCRIVSLKSFKPEGLDEIQERNVNDVRHLLKVDKKEYYSNRVSWTDAPGNYFIATKDPTDLIAFQKRLAGKQRRL